MTDVVHVQAIMKERGEASPKRKFAFAFSALEALMCALSFE